MSSLNLENSFCLDSVIEKKKKAIAKLKEDYEELSQKSNVKTNFDPEVGDLNAVLWKLMAENEVLQAYQPNVMPQQTDWLFSWVKDTLSEDIKRLEETLLHQIKQKVKSSLRRDCITHFDETERLEISRSIDEENLEEKVENQIEEYEDKNNFLELLHKKLIRRLRRFSRCISDIFKPSSHDKKRFDEVLQEFVVELQHRNYSHEWEERKSVVIDKTFSQRHINFLVDCGIIERSNENKSVFHLKESNEEEIDDTTAEIPFSSWSL